MQQNDEIIGLIKNAIIDEYEETKFQIDIDVQTDKDVLNTNLESEIRQNKIKKNTQFIQILENIFNSNIAQVNDYFKANPTFGNQPTHLDHLKTTILKESCIFISNQCIDVNNFKDKLPIGILVHCDWYLNKEQSKFIRNKFKSPWIRDIIKLNQSVLDVKMACDSSKINESYFYLSKRKKDELQIFKKLDLSRNSIQSIEKGTFFDCKNLRELDLSYNRMILLKEEYFTELNYLTTLTLRNCSINYIESGAFQHLECLEYLDLGNNRLVTLKDEDFLGLINLKELWLYKCSIATIEPGAFKQLKNLEKLILCYNDLHSLATNANPFENLIKLKHLELFYNPMIEIINTENKKRLVKTDKGTHGEQDFKNIFKLTNVENIFLSEVYSSLYI